jgi:hypothetical protein
LVNDILAAARAERSRILARIEGVDQELERLDTMRGRARKAVKDAMLVHRGPDRRRRRPDGTVEIVHGRETLVAGDLAVKRKGALREIEEAIAAYKHERAGRQAELSDVAKVERAAERGMESAVLAITQQWTNRVELGEIAERVPMARTFTDAMGYELPPETSAEEYAELMETRPRPNSSAPLEV